MVRRKEWYDFFLYTIASFFKFCYKKNPLLSNKEECGKLDIVRAEKTNVCGWNHILNFIYRDIEREEEKENKQC